jgi:ABC-type nitrate/sulfonate/bicarbonate transport system substrate-binding protein
MYRLPRFSWRIVPLVVLLVGFFSACGSSPSTATTPTATPSRPLTSFTFALDFTPNPNHAGVFVAQAKGWYKEAGIDLKILPFSPNVSSDTEVATGKADAGIGSSESTVLDAGLGQPVVSTSAITPHNTSVIAVREDEKVTQISQLDGKLYGSYGAPYEVPIVSKAIQGSGGKGVFKAVTVQTDAITDLVSKRVDFAWVFGLDVVQAKQQGVNLKTFPITQFGVPDYYAPQIISSPSMISGKADVLKNFMAATARGYEYARKNPADAAQDIVTGAKSLGAILKLPDETAGMQYLSGQLSDLGRPWSGAQESVPWQAFVQFMLNTKIVKNASGQVVTTLDYSKLYSNQFLPSSPQ